jgi:hypothetical protein
MYYNDKQFSTYNWASNNKTVVLDGKINPTKTCTFKQLRVRAMGNSNNNFKEANTKTTFWKNFFTNFSSFGHHVITN